MNTIKNEENCAKLIVSGLVHYYFSKRVQDLKIDFKIEKDSLRVIAEGNVKIKPKDLEELNRISNSARFYGWWGDSFLFRWWSFDYFVS